MRQSRRCAAATDAACGIAAFVLQLATVSMPFVGLKIVLLLLVPVGLVQLAMAIWLIVKGFADVTEFAAPRATVSGYFT